MKACVIIPARYNSSRLPGKPLALINGKPMIQYVIEASLKAVDINHIYVATDDDRIFNFVTSLGVKGLMTSSDALTGTDRIAEASLMLNYDVFVNVQGDEPMVDPADIKECISLKKNYFDQIINGYSYIKSSNELLSLTVPKVVTNDYDQMIYMSRAPIPYSKKGPVDYRRCKKQVCIYGFNKDELNWFASQKNKSFIESYEDIEILRFLNINKIIRMFACNPDTIAVDTEDDRLRVELIFQNEDEN